MKLVYDPSSPITGVVVDADDFSLTQTPLVTATDGTLSYETAGDSTSTTYAGATVKTEAVIVIVSANLDATYTVESLTPSVGTIDPDTLRVSWVSNGDSRIRVTNQAGFTVEIVVPVSVEVPAPATLFDSFVSGSVLRACADAVDALIDGLTASTTTKNRFSSGTTPNPDCFLNGIDLSCVSLTQWRVTAVSPLHGVSSAHGPEPVGETVSFRGNDGVVYTRTIAARQALPGFSGSNYNTYHNDIMVYLFDSPLPAAVTPAKVMPTGWRVAHAPGMAHGIPAVSFNGDRAFVTELVDDNYFQFAHDGYARFSISSDPTRAAFHEWFQSSSNPTILLPGNQPVIVCCQSFGNSTGPDVSNRIVDINALMTALGGGHQLTEFDLTPYQPFDYVRRFGLDDASGTTAADETGTANGTFVNTPTLGATGRIGKAATFTAAQSEYVTAGVLINTTQDYTLAAWVNPSTQAGTQTVFAINGSLGLSCNVDLRSVSAIPCRPTVNVYAANTSTTAPPSATFLHASSIPAGSWTHVAMTYTAATKTARLYVNGALSGSATASAHFQATATTTIGTVRYTNQFLSFMNGSIDDFREYQRVLSAGEIAAITSEE